LCENPHKNKKPFYSYFKGSFYTIRDMDIFERMKAKKEAKRQLWEAHWKAMENGEHSKAKEIEQTIFDKNTVKNSTENPIYSGATGNKRKTRSDKGKKRGQK
jgi:hypothetical protein